jgi:hypothetical protein
LDLVLAKENYSINRFFIKMKFKNEKHIESKIDENVRDTLWSLGFILLILFCALRPNTLLNLNVGIFGCNVFENFAIT